MRVNSNDIIAGVQAKNLRRFFRDNKFNNFNPDDLKYYDYLKLNSSEKIFEFIKNMIEEGFIKKESENSRPGQYTLDDKALTFSNAKFIKPISREKADTVVKELLERVETLNKDNYYLVRVDSIHAFGSYIDENAKDFGDIDLIIKLKRKDGIDNEEARKLSFERSPDWMDWFGKLCYAEYTEPLRFLKNKNKYLSFCGDDVSQHKTKKIFG
jgi:predicted nucleotidyltransferase